MDEIVAFAPVDEVRWVLGERAHAGRLDVEQVLLVVGAVGDSAAQTVARVDEDDVDVRRPPARPPGQVDGRERPGRSRADHDHRRRLRRDTVVTPPPLRELLAQC